MAMLGTFIMIQAIAAIVTLALAIGLYQDQQKWETDTALLFAAALLSLMITFPTHFLTTSEAFLVSNRRVMWRVLAALIQFGGFALGAAAFIYGLATNVNKKCTDAGLTYCQVFRITLAFDTLVWLFQIAGFLSIIMSLRTPKPKH